MRGGSQGSELVQILRPSIPDSQIPSFNQLFLYLQFSERFTDRVAGADGVAGDDVASSRLQFEYAALG